MLDVLFIAPGNAKGIYQDLANDYSAIEPLTWALLLAESCRSTGFVPQIIDVTAQQLSHQDVVDKINSILPRVIVLVVYGQNVNSGTTGMSGAVILTNFIKQKNIEIPIVYIGSHVQALPVETLKKESSIDIVCLNEGVYALQNLLKLSTINIKTLSTVNGIGYKKDKKVYLTKV